MKRKKRRRKYFTKKRKEKLGRIIIIGMGILVLIFLGKITFFPKERNENFRGNLTAEKPEITEDFLTVNPYSRSGIALKEVKGIVIHYVANPGSKAIDNRNYFENLKDTHQTKASSHFIVGLKGEIIQCIPLDEISYASNERNKDTISIECCHPKKDGRFNESTYQALLQLTAWLCQKYGLKSKDIIRHYDVTGKLCPKYFVEHPEAWDEFLENINILNKNK